MEEDADKVNEESPGRHPSPHPNRTITFFKSFEEARDGRRQQMANRTPRQRLQVLEQMRKHFLKDYLLPNGKWPPLQLVITIKKGVFK
jgi:hypothetical protein